MQCEGTQTSLSQYETSVVTLNVARIVPWTRIRSTRQKDINKLIKSITERNFTNIGSSVVVCRIPQTSIYYEDAKIQYVDFMSKINPSMLNNNKPKDYEESDCFFGIIDGCHRITALKQVVLAGKNLGTNLYIRCQLLDHCPEEDAIHLAKELNEQSSTVIAPSLLNYVEYIGRSSNFFPSNVDKFDLNQVLQACKNGSITKFKMKSSSFKVFYKLWLVSIISSFSYVYLVIRFI